MVVLRLTALPAISVPLSVTVTPAIPVSPASMAPLLLRSSQTRPLITLLLAISPKWLPAEPVTGRLLMVMALAPLLLALVPGFSLPLR